MTQRRDAPRAGHVRPVNPGRGRAQAPVRHDRDQVPPAAFDNDSIATLQRLAGNQAVARLLEAPTPPSALARLPVAGRAALYAGPQRRVAVSRKVSNLPAMAYSGTALLAKAKAKRDAFNAVQGLVLAYNAESGETPADLTRQQELLRSIRVSVANWVETYGKSGASDAVHKKQRYTQFTLPHALNAEIQANEKLIATARPVGASGGIAMPGMSPVRRPVIPPVPASAASGGGSKPPTPASRGGQVAAVGPSGVVESKEPAGPSPDQQELTDFQQGIVAAYQAMQAKEADDDASLVARAFLDTMYANLASFSDSIMGGGEVDEKGRPMAGSRVRDLIKLKQALVAIQSGANDDLYALLDIPKADEKDLGLEKVTGKLAKANQAIAALGAITPAIAERFASAATNTNRIGKGKAVAKAAAGAGMGFVPVPGVSQAFSAAMAINTVRSTLLHLRNLKKIQVMALSKGDANMVELLDYIIGKKESKAKKAGASGVPLLGSAAAAVYKMKGAWKLAKGTAGAGRKQAAADLIDAAKNNHLEAQLVIMELVDSVDEYQEVLIGGPAGADILSNKMKSA